MKRRPPTSLKLRNDRGIASDPTALPDTVTEAACDARSSFRARRIPARAVQISHVATLLCFTMATLHPAGLAADAPVSAIMQQEEQPPGKDGPPSENPTPPDQQQSPPQSGNDNEKPTESPGSGNPTGESETSGDAGAKGEPPTTPARDLQPPPKAEVAATLTIDEVQSRLSTVESATDLPDEVKAETTNLYKQALTLLEQAKKWRQKAEDYKAGIEQTSSLLEEVKKPIVTDLPQPSETPMTLEEISQEVIKAEAARKEKEEALNALEEEAKQRTDRRAAIPNLLAATNSRLEEAKRELSKTNVSADAQTVLARKTLLTAQRIVAQDEITSCQQELQFYDARNEVLAARRDRARKEFEVATKRSEHWRQRAADRRVQEADAERRKAKARQQVAEANKQSMPEVVTELAAENLELAEEWKRLGADIESTEANTVALRGKREGLAKQLETLKSRYQLPNMTSLLGPQLRRQRAELQAINSNRRSLDKNHTQFATTQLRLVEVEAEIRRLLAIEPAVEEVLKDADLGKSDPAEVHQEVEQLLTTRRETLQKLRRDYDTLITDLVNEAVALNGLFAEAEQLESFIEERVLWFPSSSALTRIPTLPEWRPHVDAAMRMLKAARRELFRRPAGYIGATLVFLVLLAVQPLMRRRIRTMCDAVSKPLTDRYDLTIRTLLATFALSLPWPALIAFLGFFTDRLDLVDDNNAFHLAQALSGALYFSSTLFLFFTFLQQACRKKGLAVSHFRWEADGIRIARRSLLLLIVPITALAGFVTFTELSMIDNMSASLGRIAFIAAMFLVAALVWSLSHPDRGAISTFYAKRKDATLTKFRWVIFCIGMILPIGCAALSFAGYHYTAVSIQQSVLQTAALTAMLILLHGMATRGIFYAQRQLAIAEAKRRREAQLAQQGEQGPSTTPDVAIEDSDLHIGKIGAQTRQLLSSSVWFGLIMVVYVSWSNLLPALTYYVDFPLWTYSVETVTSATGSDGGPAVQTTKGVEVITLANVLLSMIIFVFTLALARNLPGLLEIAFLRRVVPDSGTRFAVVTVARYVITVFGIVLAFNAIGVGWSKVQWLIAAVTVGLGFGLQEIFANFVSGLILLIERPIRIGDIVTVSNTTGTVSRMRIRATTITDWDRKELVIPNKEFVTGAFVNWSLSDPILRLVVPVGIAYGSDVDLAKELLMKCAKKDPRVLDQPKPQVWFWGFGDSSLNFEVRVFLKDIDDYVLSRDALHFSIDGALRKAGIEIAFPQRDLHIRSIDKVIEVTQPRRDVTPGATAPDAITDQSTGNQNTGNKKVIDVPDDAG